LELEKFDESVLIKELVRRFAELHPDIPLMVRVNGAAAGTWDRFRIDQAVSNLISNAIKYGLRKPITVAVSVDDKKVCVAVQDQGIGIAPDDAERVSNAPYPNRTPRVWDSVSGLPNVSWKPMAA
jgi:signal transduction histidine kinase